MEDTPRDSCVFVQVTDAIMPQGDLFSVHENIGKLSAKYSVLSTPSPNSASSQAKFAALSPSLLGDIALIPCLYGAKTITVW